MSYTRPMFDDRQDAGRQLAAALARMRLPHPVVLALPRGGVPVAYEVARQLEAPLGVVMVRKLGAPYSPEFAIGAVAEIRRQHRIVDPDLLRRIGVDNRYLDQQAAREFAEIARRRSLYTGENGSLAPPLEGCSAIVIDDGIATGHTMRAALAAVTEERPGRLLFAAPVAAADSIRALEELAESVCLHSPTDFRAVSLYYRNFDQTSDDEVVALLRQAHAAMNIQRKENSMQRICDVMTRDVAVISPDDTLQQAAQLMRDWNIGSLPVCDGKRLVGMITDRDITIRATADGKDARQACVREIMSGDVRYCFEDQRIGEVLQEMRDEQIRRLPVIDRNMQLCGVVALGDLAVKDDADIDNALEGISMPSEPNRPSADQRSQRH